MPILDLFIWTRMTGEQPASIRRASAPVCLHPDRKWAKFSFPLLFYPQFENVLKQEDRKFYCFFCQRSNVEHVWELFSSGESFLSHKFASFHHISNLFCTKEKMSWRDNLHTAQCLKFTCNFCSTKIGNIVWPKASGFQKLAKLTIFGIFNEVASKCKRSSLRSTM